MSKVVTSVLVLLLVGAVGVGVYVVQRYQREQRENAEEERVDKAKKAANDRAVALSYATVIEVTATTLAGAYRSNEVSADAAYKDQPLHVDGRVHHVERTARGRALLVLAGDALWGVECEVPADDPSVGMVKKGQRVWLRGVGAGKRDLDAVVSECAIDAPR